MSLKRFLSKPDLQAKVAIANMCAVGLCAGIFIWLFPDGTLVVYSTTEWKQTLFVVVGYVAMALVFPIGWIADVVYPSVHPTLDNVLLTVVSIPVNAYLWGYVVKRIAARHPVEEI